MNYLKKRLLVFMNQSPTYGKNFDRIFRKSWLEKAQELVDNILVWLFLK